MESVIILDSDSDDGEIMKNPSNSKGGKRKATQSPPTTHTGTQLNGTSSGSSVASASGGAQDPQRKRIKPITIASNLSEKRWTDGKTPPHNNNNNNQPIVMNENFAPITYSEDWEQEIKQYQQKLAGAGGDKRERSLSAQATATVTTATSSRSSTSTNDDSDPNRSSTSTPGPNDKSISETQASHKLVPRETRTSEANEKNPIGKEFQDLLDACRNADSSNDMELLIKKKLIRYYEIVHPDYVNSKSFKKAVVEATAGIRAQPNLVFLKLVDIVEELNARRKSRSVAPPVTEPEDNPVPEQEISTGNAKKDRQIARLNKALYILKKRIHQMEEAEVDFSHETNSTYLMAERYKKRAFEIYEKLCDITGESKNAHRLVRKPIQFQGTQYAEFNHTLSMFVNRTNMFPNFRDVLKCLEHCNIKHDYRLRPERMNRIAHDAFIKVGKQLQKRRKTDLYETVMYHAGEEKDPASVDPKLREKLEENGKHYGKVNSIIDKYAEKELGLHEEEHETTHKSSTPAEHNKEMPSSSKKTATATNSEVTANGETNTSVHELSDDDEDDEDDDEEDEDDDEDDAESTTKENVRPDSFEDVIISDDDELIVLDS